MAPGGLAGRRDQPLPDPPLQGANAHSNSPCGVTRREKTPVSHVLTLGSRGALQTGPDAFGTSRGAFSTSPRTLGLTGPDVERHEGHRTGASDEGAWMTEPTEFCPRGARCESCGSAGPALSVKVYDVLSEKMCLTVCSGCRGSDRPPSVMLSTAQRLVEQHRQHLAGLDRPIYRIHLPS